MLIYLATCALSFTERDPLAFTGRPLCVIPVLLSVASIHAYDNSKSFGIAERASAQQQKSCLLLCIC